MAAPTPTLERRPRINPTTRLTDEAYDELLEATRNAYLDELHAEFGPSDLDEKQFAEHIGQPLQTVRRWRVDGTGPPFLKYPSARIGYPKPGVAAWKALLTLRSTRDGDVAVRGEGTAPAA